jgi:putative ribosome biogenesis GTPase RsgA
MNQIDIFVTCLKDCFVCYLICSNRKELLPYKSRVVSTNYNIKSNSKQRMVESTKQRHEIPEKDPSADPHKKHFVLTIGGVGHGKSTLNNALIGAHKNEASDATSGVTQNFKTNSSILPEFKDTAFIDSPGLNDPDMALENWVAKYNNTIGQQGAPRLSLVVLLI